jgi:5-methylcytosine-specific restriction endonuclease McrBC GTP-binding regulatory subunit McrB
MKTLIREVIKLDQQARQKIEALKKEKEEISIAFKEMKADLKAQQKLEIDAQTKQLEIDAQALFEERLTQYQQKTTIKETSILEQYEANKDQWLKDLMDFILGDVN